MSEIQIIIDAIDKIGFPIVAFLLMFWFSVKVIRDNTKAIHALTLSINKQNNLFPILPQYQHIDDRYRKP
jgi:hypothetical protein